MFKCEPGELGHAAGRRLDERFHPKDARPRIVRQGDRNRAVEPGCHVAVNVLGRDREAEGTARRDVDGGSVEMTNCEAASGVTVIGVVVAEVRPVLET